VFSYPSYLGVNPLYKSEKSLQELMLHQITIPGIERFGVKMMQEIAGPDKILAFFNGVLSIS